MKTCKLCHDAFDPTRSPDLNGVCEGCARVVLQWLFEMCLGTAITPAR